MKQFIKVTAVFLKPGFQRQNANDESVYLEDNYVRVDSILAIIPQDKYDTMPMASGRLIMSSASINTVESFHDIAQLVEDSYK